MKQMARAFEAAYREVTSPGRPKAAVLRHALEQIRRIDATAAEFAEYGVGQLTPLQLETRTFVAHLSQPTAQGQRFWWHWQDSMGH